LEAWKSGDPQDKRAKAEYKKACAKAAREGKPRPPAPLQPPAAGESDKEQVGACSAIHARHKLDDPLVRSHVGQ